MKTYRFISDPGHGWLEVPTSELLKLGIAYAVSSCSYITLDGKMAYLEEDCDAPKFASAKGWKGAGPIVEVYQENTFIRELPRFPRV